MAQADKKQNDSKTGNRSEIYKRLHQMRKELVQGISQSIKQESNSLSFDVGDFYDYASGDRERELAHTLTDRERERLFQVEDALRRIEEGSYGICDICGIDIQEGRLLALPFTKYCFACQEDLEMQKE